MNLIFSADANWGLGKDNQLLFRVAPDMAQFRKKTLGGVVIMGRKTLASLPGGRPLKERANVVLTKHPENLQQEDVLACKDIPALATCLAELNVAEDRVWVIGGAAVYRHLLPYCREAWVTRFMAEAEADCFMVDLDQAPGWVLAQRGEDQVWEGLTYRFDRYRQLAPRTLSAQGGKGI